MSAVIDRPLRYVYTEGRCGKTTHLEKRKKKKTPLAFNHDDISYRYNNKLVVIILSVKTTR